MFSPTRATTTYLIDMDGEVVHRWFSDSPGGPGYLLADGSLLRKESVPNPVMRSGGFGGRITRYAWDSTVLWRYDIADDERIQHHDIEPMPYGNVLALCWELKSRDEAIAAGRDPDALADIGIWAEYVVEVKPIGESDAEIVWEWHLWDHLVQDLDQTRSNFGSVSEHAGRVDLNFPGNRAAADWTHANSLDYNPQLDQVAISVRIFSEAWVVDHATTSAEAAGPAGDLLYRWGNPRAYGRGTEVDQRLFLQHDVHWIEAGRPGAGNLMSFNNGARRPGGNYSSVDEWVPSNEVGRRYALDADTAYGPEAASWSFSTGDESFYSSFISGTHRLGNGNTLITSGVESRLFEVTPDGQIVWDYVNPLTVADDPQPAAGAGERQGRGRRGGRGRGGRGGRGGGPPPTGIFRATRYDPSHPGLAALRER